ncbi:MAG TPA: type II secretion system F family protein [Streptosporangiaceae bacterium]
MTRALTRGWLAGLTVLLLALLTLAAGAGPWRAEASGPPRVVIILFDTNISPWTRQLPTERQAAGAYLRALPPGVEVGLIVFNDTWKTVLAPTADLSRLRTALDAARPAGVTSNGLAGALTGAERTLRRLGATGRSRLLVLTDGEYMKQPRQTVSVPVDVITWRHDADDYVRIAQQVAVASGGHSASPGGAAGLTTLLPKAPHRHGATRPAPAAASGWRPTISLGIMLGLVFLALLVLALLGVRSLRRPDQRPELLSRIERYGPQGTALAVEDSSGKLAGRAVGLMSRLLQHGDTEPRLARRLDHAGLGRPPAEWALLGVCVCAGLAAFFTIAFGNAAFGVIAGALTGWVTMRLVLSVKISRRRAAFDEQLPTVLQLVAGSLQTGLSLSQALDSVVREDTPPASGEFARALAEARLGVDLDVALDGVADRLNSADLRWVIMAIRIQRETGGNLAEVLRNTVATMRERAYLRRQVRSLSAEGRLSAYVLLALPFAVGGWLLYSNPSYMHPLFSTAFGLIMLAVASVLVVIGAFWMRNLINVEV